MNIPVYLRYILPSIFILGTILAACQPPAEAPEPIIETLVVTEIVQGTPVQVIRNVTPTPEPTGPRTLVICEANESGSLYDFETDNISAYVILAAVYDGPIDSNSYGYQPVILEKLPNLADGDALR